MTRKFDNRSTEDLADEFGSIKQQIETLEDQEKEIGDELKARLHTTFPYSPSPLLLLLLE